MNEQIGTRTGPVTPRPSATETYRRTPLASIAHLAIKTWCWHTVRDDLRLELEGTHHLPQREAALLVCRHYHHYYDGCILLALARRPLHLLVALDWVPARPLRVAMEAACDLAAWPVVLRGERLQRESAQVSAYAPHEARPRLKAALVRSVSLLRAGEALALFPEAYPTVDPVYTPKTSDADFLPFRHGFARIALAAQRDGRTRVPIIPVGLHYGPAPRPRVLVRVGAPLTISHRQEVAAITDELQRQVEWLSRP